MSNIVLQPNASGTGSITITTPNTNTDRTLNIPDVAGNLITTGDTGTVTAGMVAGVNSSALPAGSVIQVVQAQYSTQISTSNTSDFDIITVNITPQSSSSKFLVHGEVMGIQRGTASGARFLCRLKRDAVNIHSSDANLWTTNTQDLRHGGYSISQLDSPATTSQITYKLVGKWSDHSSPSYVNKDGNSGSSTITVMEIVG